MAKVGDTIHWARGGDGYHGPVDTIKVGYNYSLERIEENGQTEAEWLAREINTRYADAQLELAEAVAQGRILQEDHDLALEELKAAINSEARAIFGDIEEELSVYCRDYFK